jgi:hypothetical protein
MPYRRAYGAGSTDCTGSRPFPRTSFRSCRCSMPLEARRASQIQAATKSPPPRFRPMPGRFFSEVLGEFGIGVVEPPVYRRRQQPLRRDWIGSSGHPRRGFDLGHIGGLGKTPEHLTRLCARRFARQRKGFASERVSGAPVVGEGFRRTAATWAGRRMVFIRASSAQC